MKFNIEIDGTPEEMRRLVGLPDIAGLQDEMIALMRDKIVEGIESFDPVTLAKAFVPEQLPSLDGLKQRLRDTVGVSTKSSSSKKTSTQKKRSTKKR